MRICRFGTRNAHLSSLTNRLTIRTSRFARGKMHLVYRNEHFTSRNRHLGSRNDHLGFRNRHLMPCNGHLIPRNGHFVPSTHLPRRIP